MVFDDRQSITVDILHSSLGEASESEGQSYADAVKAAVEAEYPEADVTINYRINFSGLKPEPRVHGFEDDESVAEDVDHIAQRVWDRQDYPAAQGWVVWMGATYADEEGTIYDIEGSDLQTMQAELSDIDAEASWITVYDDPGFVRGWISGSEWRYA